jgi:hypothetical protein
MKPIWKDSDFPTLEYEEWLPNLAKSEALASPLLGKRRQGSIMSLVVTNDFVGRLTLFLFGLAILWSPRVKSSVA